MVILTEKEPDGLPLALSFGERVAEEVEVPLGEEDTLSLALREGVVVLEDKDEEAVAVPEPELESVGVSVVLALEEEDGDTVAVAEP